MFSRTPAIDHELISTPPPGRQPTEIGHLRRPGNWQNLVISWVALLVLAYFATLQVSKWPNRLRYPGEEDAAEGTQLSEMLHLRRGVRIYRLPSGGEFDGAIYGPLCYLLGAALSGPDQPSYLPLRLLSLSATLSLLGLGALFVFKLTDKRVGAALTVLLLLSTVFIARYGISARADMVALLLAFSGFFVVYSYRGSRRALILGAILMLLSFFYKQQFIGAPVAVFTYLILVRRFRQALVFATTMVSGGLILIGAFSFLIFPHQAFLLHFISYNHLPFDKTRVLPEILMFVVPLFISLLGSADFVDQHSDKLVTCYVAASVGVYFLLLFSSGSGADTNRVLEPALVLSCVFAARLATTERLFPGLVWIVTLTASLVLVVLLRAAFVVPQVRPDDFAADSAMQTYLRSHFRPGTSVLGYYAGDPLRAGLDVPITNLWAYSALVRKNAMSDDDVVSRIGRHGYGAILLDFDLSHVSSGRMADFYTTPAMRDAVLRNYQLTARLPLSGTELTRYTDGNMYVWIAQGKLPVVNAAGGQH